MSKVQILQGDCRLIMSSMAEASVDSIVCDPPYELTSARPRGRSEATRGKVMGGFMGMKWDNTGVAFDTETWRQALRVLKPGGHLLAFSGTRTYHRMVCAIEDAGFEIRDQIGWVYGCLDDQTELVTMEGIMPYHKTKIGDLVLCYDAAHGEYTYQSILEIVEYDYSDTAYRLVGDFGEQVVSRNHRVIVERGGSEAFQLAETLECEARVPVLESLPALQQAIHNARPLAGCPQQDVQCGVHGGTDREGEHRADAVEPTQGQDDYLCGVRGKRMEAGCVAAQGRDADVQHGMQRGAARCGVGEARSQRPRELAACVGGGAEGSHDGADESILEGWTDLQKSQGCVCRSADQVRALPGGIDFNGAERRLRDATSAHSGAGDRPDTDTRGIGSPHQPRCDGQPEPEPDAVQHERGTQGVRAWGGHKTALVRVVPFHYTGKVWCLRVPTGAFVAVRNGVAFPTGNSGFPKSLDVSKAIDKAQGNEGTFGAPKSAAHAGWIARGRMRGEEGHEGWQSPWMADKEAVDRNARQYVGGSEDSRQWEGWGTALKPAWEPIVVARKPLIGTVAANVLAHGTGALNIDGCRVPGASETRDRDTTDGGSMFGTGAGGGAFVPAEGRWPANIILSYPEDEYRLRDDVTPAQLQELAGWLSANA